MPYLQPPSEVKGTAPTALDSGGTSSPFAVGQQFLDSVKTADYTNEFGVFLIFDGRTLQKVDYEALFNYFAGSQYQIDSNSFRLPDPRGKTLGIAGGTHGLGSSTGDETRTLSTSNLPSHSHTINHNHPSTTSGSGGDNFISEGEYGLIKRSTGSNTIAQTDNTSGEPDLVAAPGSWSHTHSTSTPWHYGSSGSTGSNQSFSIMQPTAFLFNVFIYAGQ